MNRRQGIEYENGRSDSEDSETNADDDRSETGDIDESCGEAAVDVEDSFVFEEDGLITGEKEDGDEVQVAKDELMATKSPERSQKKINLPTFILDFPVDMVKRLTLQGLYLN